MAVVMMIWNRLVPTTTLAFIKAGYNVLFVPVQVQPRVGTSKIRLARDGARFFLRVPGGMHDDLVVIGIVPVGEASAFLVPLPVTCLEDEALTALLHRLGVRTPRVVDGAASRRC